MNMRRWSGFVFTACLSLLFAAPIKGADNPAATAIERGVKYLAGIDRRANDDGNSVGVSALCGLALLESGVSPDDPALQKIAALVREEALSQTKTYNAALVLLFLDRLDGTANRGAIQFLAVRILAGQSVDGGWSYVCGFPLEEPELARLKKSLFAKSQLKSADGSAPVSPAKNPLDKSRSDLPGDSNEPPAPKKSSAPKNTPIPQHLHPDVERFAKWLASLGGSPMAFMGGDNSNTQFAVLALWTARKHGVPTDNALALADKRFRGSQGFDGGWGYRPINPLLAVGGGSTPPMTCAGLLALAAGRGIQMHALRTKGGANGSRPDRANPVDDRAIAAALNYLESAISEGGAQRNNNPAPPFGGGLMNGEDLSNNLYFLWSLERVAMIFDLDAIGKVDWYKWGSELLIRSQVRDGSWPNGNYQGANTEINTAFALLFLNRANLAKDLTATLRGKASSDVKLPARNTDPESVKVEPKQTTPKVTAEFDAEANRLANSLVTANGSSRGGVLTQLRDTKGSVHTEALARAIPKLQAEAQREAREALAMRLKRMTANTLRDMLKDENPEIRSASASACALKEDKQYIPDLIGLLTDNESLVVQSARTSLRRLSSKDFGPPPEATAPEKTRSAAAWRTWWNGQPK